MSDTIRIVLAPGVTIQDVSRALQYSGFSVSNTMAPNLFAIKRAERRLPENVVEFQQPALIRRQAD